MPIQHSSCRQSEWEGDPDAHDAQSARETEYVTHRQGDDEVGDEGVGHHRLHASDATEGVGEGVLQTVTKLIYHHQDDEHCHVLLYFHIVGEESTYLMTEEKHGDTHQDGEHQVESPTVVGILSYRLEVLLSYEVAHTNRHCRSHARKHEIEELRGGNHHLVGGERNRSEPSHHHATQRECSRLHRQLQCHRPAQAVHLPEVSLVERGVYDVVSVLLEFLSEDDHSHHHHRHEDAAAHGGESGTEQAQLREGSHAIDEHPVAEDVQYIAANHHPHRHLGMRDAIEELFHRIEDADEEY